MYILDYSLSDFIIFSYNILKNMEYTTKKLESSYSRLINEAIRLISYNPKKIKIYGSGSLKSFLFAGDIDLYETINIKAKTEEEASKKFVKILQNINNKIGNHNISIVTDIKAGLFTSYAKVLDNLGYIKNGKIIGYNPEKIRKLIEENYPRREIKENVFVNIGHVPSVKQMLELVKNKPTMTQFLELQEQVRLDATIRWNQTEIDRGWQEWIHKIGTPQQKAEKFYMWKAIIKNKAPIKIDMLFPISDRLIEVTNFFIFNWIDTSGRKHIINNYTETKKDFIQSLKDQVNKLINLKKVNYLKALKRVATIMRLSKDYKGLDKIMPILESNCGLLYQIIGDMKALILYLQIGVSFDQIYIFNEIDIFRSRLANIYEFDFKEELIDSQIKDILNHRFTQPYIIKKLNNIVDILSEVLNKETMKNLRNIKFTFKKYLP